MIEWLLNEGPWLLGGLCVGFIIGMFVFASLKAGKCSDCTLSKVKEFEDGE